MLQLRDGSKQSFVLEEKPEGTFGNQKVRVSTAEESGIDQIRVDQRPDGVAFDLQGRPHPCGSQADSKSVRICNRQLMLVR